MKTAKRDSPQKLRLHRFSVGEISGVDYMAQPPARAVLIKREEGVEKVAFSDALMAMDLEEGVRNAISRIFRLTDALSSSVHSIVKEPEEYPDPKGAVQDSLRSFANEVAQTAAGAVSQIESDDSIFKSITKAEDGEKFPSSDYAYVPDRLSPLLWEMRLTDAPGGEPVAQKVEAAIEKLGAGSFKLHREEDLESIKKRLRVAFEKAMPGDDLPQILKEEGSTVKKENSELEKKVEDLEKRAERAEALAKMNDAQKKHFEGLSKTDQESFLTMSDSQREAELAKKADADPVVYTTMSGREIRKSAGADYIEMAKEADEEKRQNQALRKSLDDKRIEKRVADEFKHLPGEVAGRRALIKAVEGIEDEDLRKQAEEVLSKTDANISEVLKTRGTTGGPNSPVESSAEGKLNAMAKKYSEEHNVSFEKGFSEVIMTPDGSSLYTEMEANNK